MGASSDTKTTIIHGWQNNSFTGFVFRMNINTSSTKPVSFKGYDAQPLKAVIMTVCDDPKAYDVFEQMSKIGKKDGFTVYFTNQTNKLYTNLKTIKNFFFENSWGKYTKWAQDHAVLTPQKNIVTHGLYAESGIAERLSTIVKRNNKIQGRINSSWDFVEGGNLFFVKNKNNKEQYELFIGSEEMTGRTVESLKKTYGVSAVRVIPQADYHLDVFMRPLNKNKILVADDKLTIKWIQKGLRGIEKYKKTHTCSEAEIKEVEEVKKELEELLKTFKKDVKDCKNYTADDIEKVLTQYGYETVRIPGRLYDRISNSRRDDLTHKMNYMNALVHEKADGSLTYITNKSTLNTEYGITHEISEKIGFDFEKMFIESMKPYVREEDIHFISGNGNYISETLKKQNGGIHCLCNEIPSEILN